VTPAAVRDALLRRALEVRACSPRAAAWLSDASLAALGWVDVDGARVLGPGTVDDVDELVREAEGVEAGLVAWAAGLLRQVARPTPARPAVPVASGGARPCGPATCTGYGWHFTPRGSR
jgi:hypothetical protein